MPDNFSIDRTQRRLFRAGAVFDPTARRWSASDERAGEPVGLRDAVRWLQTESGTPCRVPVAVIGPRDATARAGDTSWQFAGSGTRPSERNATASDEAGTLVGQYRGRPHTLHWRGRGLKFRPVSRWSGLGVTSRQVVYEAERVILA